MSYNQVLHLFFQPLGSSVCTSLWKSAFFLCCSATFIQSYFHFCKIFTVLISFGFKQFLPWEWLFLPLRCSLLRIRSHKLSLYMSSQADTALTPRNSPIKSKCTLDQIQGPLNQFKCFHWLQRMLDPSHHICSSPKVPLLVSNRPT